MLQSTDTVDMNIPFNIAIVSNLSGLEGRLKAQGFENYYYVNDTHIVHDGKITPIFRSGKERGLAISRVLDSAVDTRGLPITLIVRTDGGWVNTLIDSATKPGTENGMAAAIWTSVENSLVGFGTLRRRRGVYLETYAHHHLIPAGQRLPQSWVANHPTRAERSPNNRHAVAQTERMPSFHESIFLAIKGHFNDNIKGTKVQLLPSFDKLIGLSVLGRFICASTGNRQLTMADYNSVLHSALVAMTMRPYWNNMEAMRDLVAAGSSSPHDVTLWLVNRIMLSGNTVLTTQPMVDAKSMKLWEDCHNDLKRKMAQPVDESA